MPRIRTPPTNSERPAPSDPAYIRHVGQQTQRKRGGRKKGTPNRHTLVSREAIIIGLNEAGGREGMIGIVKQLIEKNIENAIPLFQLITPRQVDATINQEATVRYQTVAEIDAELAKRGLRPVREIFQIDYKSTPATLPGSAPVTEPEIIPPNQTVGK
jgi:hypothetical protein